MKTLALGVLVGVGLVIAVVGVAADRGEVIAQQPAYRFTAAEGGLIALSTKVGEKYQQLAVIDPKLRVLSVYHVDLASGDIELRCVRNIHWDLQMTYYNGKAPLPQEIQSLLEATK
jgi:hypothetical protein